MADSVIPGAPGSQRVPARASARAAATVGPIPTYAPAIPLPPAAAARPGQVRCAPSRAAMLPSGGAEPSTGTGAASPSQCSSARGDVEQWVAASHSTTSTP